MTHKTPMTGWVIERYINNELRYWGGRAVDNFTPKNEDAIRFAREEDASLVLAWICDGHGRAAEHTWAAVIPALVGSGRGYHDCVECGDGKRDCTCGLSPDPVGGSGT